jgi:hypothetical protein
VTNGDKEAMAAIAIVSRFFIGDKTLCEQRQCCQDVSRPRSPATISRNELLRIPGLKLCDEFLSQNLSLRRKWPDGRGDVEAEEEGGQFFGGEWF